METLRITIPVGDAYEVGDYAEVYLNDDKLSATPVPLVAGRHRYTGWHRTKHLGVAHLTTRPRGGYLAGTFLAGRLAEPDPEVVVDTPRLYYGAKVIRVEALDYLGNPSPDPAEEHAVFLGTAPTPPRQLRYLAQDPGGGPVTFGFEPSAELST